MKYQKARKTEAGVVATAKTRMWEEFEDVMKWDLSDKLSVDTGGETLSCPGSSQQRRMADLER